MANQKSCGSMQIGTSGLGSSKQLFILSKESHAYRSLILSISKELSERETPVKAYNLYSRVMDHVGE